MENRSDATQAAGYEVRVMHLCEANSKHSAAAELRLQQRHLVSVLDAPPALASALWGPSNTVTGLAQYASFWLRAALSVRGVRAWAAACVLSALCHGALPDADGADRLLWTAAEAREAVLGVLLNAAVPTREVHRYLDTPRVALHVALAAATAPVFHDATASLDAHQRPAAVVHWHLLQVASFMLEVVAKGAGLERASARCVFLRAVKADVPAPVFADEAVVGVCTVQVGTVIQQVGRRRRRAAAAPAAPKPKSKRRRQEPPAPAPAPAAPGP